MYCNIKCRSRSKERLLSKLAHSGEIVITSEEDDDIAGKKKLNQAMKRL